MTLAVLLQTSRVSAEATVERLQAAQIDAQVVDDPNVWVKLASAGNYRVRVAVPEEELERARGELARLARESEPRVRSLAREVQLVLVCATFAAALLGTLLFRFGARVALGGATGLWILCLAAWVVRSRARAPEGE